METTNEKRGRQPPIPDNISDYLNADQLTTLNQFESFGWRLEFIRRPLFQEVISVVIGPDNKQIGILEKDGSINQEADITLRN